MAEAKRLEALSTSASSTLKDGDVAGSLAKAAKVIEAEYYYPTSTSIVP